MTTKAPIKTEVLEESSKRFGDGMSAFMDVSTQYIGYLRSKPTVQLTMREDESGVADFEEKESTTGGGSFGGFDLPGLPLEERKNLGNQVEGEETKDLVRQQGRDTREDMVLKLLEVDLKVV